MFIRATVVLARVPEAFIVPEQALTIRDDRSGIFIVSEDGRSVAWREVTVGIRVNKETMVQQLKEAGQEHFLQLPYHQAILNDEIPLSIGGGIGQSRTYMYLLRTAHIGEVSTSVWPDALKAISKRKNIHVLE